MRVRRASAPRAAAHGMALLAAWLVALVAVAGLARAGDLERLKLTDSQIEPIAWEALDGWASDDQAAAFATFRTSCGAIVRQHPREERPLLAALKSVCRRALALNAPDAARARAFFQDNFRAMRIAKLGEKSGLLTGYFEPIVEGSRFPSPEFPVPIYRRPRDILVNGQKPAPGVFPNRAIVNRFNAKHELVPFYDRTAIEDGALDGQRLEICWIKDPFDAVSIQIQGSARVKLEDGTTLRINYDGHNGYQYTAIGRILIEQNLVPRDEMSMDRIRRWMVENPERAKWLRGTNRSFVFFRVTGLSDDNEPAGAQNVPLTPGRSIAVDKVHVYGTPFFIEAELPIESPRPTTKFRRLMVAQDTGSAIVGPARADLYFGAGDEAGHVSGRIRQQGRFTMLIPRDFDDGVHETIPLPLPKPAAEVARASDKGQPEGKSRSRAEHRGRRHWYRG